MTRPNARPDLIDSRIGIHDSNHVEVKLDYRADSSRKHSRYQVDCYLFVPRSLGINRHSYPREHFYSDIQGYIRFKTPVVELRTLADATKPASPLGTIDATLAALRRQPRNPELRRRLSHELRMFGCIARAQVRDRARALQEALERPLGPSDAATFAWIDASIETFLADLAVLLDAWRQRRAGLGNGRLPSSVEVRETFAYTDEYLSQILEHKLTTLIAATEAHEPLTGARSRLCEAVLAERSHRKASGYDGVDDGDPEHFVYRRGLLKKLVNSVLWLEISKQKEGRGLGNLGAAIAAGAAMAFALVAAIYGSRWYHPDTWAFVFVGTVIYIFKDRTKDWLKGYFSSKTGRWLADYATDIRDPISGRDIGRCRESFSYLEHDDAPPEVLALRHADANSVIERHAKPEIVIKYEKDVCLINAGLIERLHLADYEINDIMRICMAEFLVRADDPTASLPVYDPEADAVRRRDFRKTYHVNMIMVMRSPGCPPTMQRIRVVFDKRGIRRLDELTPN
jgi:hypothetical protein